MYRNHFAHFKNAAAFVPWNPQAYRGKVGRRSLIWIKNSQGKDRENETPHCPELEKGTKYYLH